MSRGPACSSQLPSQPCHDAQPSGDLPAPAAAAQGGPWGDATPCPAHIAPSSPCPAQAAPCTHPTAGWRAHTLLLPCTHAPAHRHACMHTLALLHIRTLACIRACTHMHMCGLAEPMRWQVAGDAHCHRPGAGALLRGEDEEGPRLLRLRIPRACPPVPDPIRPLRSRAISMATAEPSPGTKRHRPAPCPAAPLNVGAQGRGSRGGTRGGCCPALQASLPAPTTTPLLRGALSAFLCRRPH